MNEVAEHSFDVNEVIKDFPILDQKVNGKRLAYLDSTATSQTPMQSVKCFRGLLQAL